MRQRSLVISFCLFLTSAGQVARADDVPAGAAPPPATAPADLPTASLDSKFDLQKAADALVAQYDKDPIGRITRQMQSATDLLAEMNTNAPTQPTQQEIVVGLDEFIAMLEKRKKSG